MRLINADEITAFHELERNGKNVESLDEFPTIEQELHWIPCSERLPQKEVDVLGCRNNKTMAIMHFNPVLTARYPKGFSVVEDAFSWRQDNVIAWMPLPEPYHNS